MALILVNKEVRVGIIGSGHISIQKITLLLKRMDLRDSNNLRRVRDILAEEGKHLFFLIITCLEAEIGPTRMPL